MKFYELKPNSRYLNSYISLRNKYTKELFTNPVNRIETIKWLSKDYSKVIIAVENKSLQAALIIHFSRQGEITIFTKSPGIGLGTKLLKIGQEVAKNAGLKKIWAWTITSNTKASSLFLKNGFKSDGVMSINQEIVGKKYIKIIE